MRKELLVRTLKYVSFPRPSGGGLSQKTVNVKMLLCAPVRVKDDGKICSIVCAGAGDQANPGLVGQVVFGKLWEGH